MNPPPTFFFFFLGGATQNFFWWDLTIPISLGDQHALGGPADFLKWRGLGVDQ